MGGIGDYFHGEKAIATGFMWATSDDDDVLSYVMTLEGDPHRIKAQAYRVSCVRIDPSIRPSDRIIYVRTDRTSGIWVKDGNQFTPDIDEALLRTFQNEKYFSRYDRLCRISKTIAKLWARNLSRRTHIPFRQWNAGDVPMDRVGLPRTGVSIFLSHSGRNSIVARVLFESLKEDGKTEVWFDLDHPGEAPGHHDHVATWLKEALFDCRMFVLLVTRASVASAWVKKEIEWAKEKARTDRQFHPILLNLEGVVVPEEEGEPQITIDCEGLELGETKEELFSAVYGRSGRMNWVQEQKRRGWIFRDTPKQGYEHLMSDGGKAVSLRWKPDGDSYEWVLEYEPEPGEMKSASGRGPWQVIDVDIQAGDRVGYANLGLWSPIWMRSTRLDLEFGDVIKKYQDKVGTPDRWFLTHSLQSR